MHLPQPSSTQLHLSPPSFLQYPQRYKNQNIARNLAISQNLGQKIERCPSGLKIGTHGILEVLILDFKNSDPKIHFWANLGRRSQSYQFYLKIGTRSISRVLLLIPTLDF